MKLKQKFAEKISGLVWSTSRIIDILASVVLSNL